MDCALGLWLTRGGAIPDFLQRISPLGAIIQTRIDTEWSPGAQVQEYNLCIQFGACHYTRPGGWNFGTA